MGSAKLNVSSVNFEHIFFTDRLGNAAQEIDIQSVQLFWLKIENPNVSPVFCKLFNLAAANVVVGTSLLNDVIMIPAATSSTVIYSNFGSGLGKFYDTALSLICVTSSDISSSASPLANVSATVCYI